MHILQLNIEKTTIFNYNMPLKGQYIDMEAMQLCIISLQAKSLLYVHSQEFMIDKNKQ